MNAVGPGLYEDDGGALHIVLSEMLTLYGFADTPANREVLLEAAREALRRHFPGVPVREVD